MEKKIKSTLNKPYYHSKEKHVITNENVYRRRKETSNRLYKMPKKVYTANKKSKKNEKNEG